MSTHHVLLIESRPGIAEHTAQSLTAAGHTVHRCHEPGLPAFPCTELTQPGTCPLDQGIDVALAVRKRVLPRPTPVEDGISCTIRAGVPLVEMGPGTLDPFDQWVTKRITRDDEVEDALDEAIEIGDLPLKRDIARRVASLLERAGISPEDLSVAIERRAGETVVELRRSGEEDERLDHALAVRTLDAVRADRRHRPGQTRVHVHRR